MGRISFVNRYENYFVNKKYMEHKNMSYLDKEEADSEVQITLHNGESNQSITFTHWMLSI